MAKRLLKMNGRGLSMSRPRRVNRARQIIAAGKVDTGSSWDGRHIRDVYEDLCSLHAEHIAYQMTAQIWENRAVAYKEATGVSAA